MIDIVRKPKVQREDVVGMCQPGCLHRQLLAHIASVSPYRGEPDDARRTRRVRSHMAIRAFVTVTLPCGYELAPSSPFLAACLNRLVREQLIGENKHGYFLRPRGADLLEGVLK